MKVKYIHFDFERDIAGNYRRLFRGRRQKIAFAILTTCFAVTFVEYTRESKANSSRIMLEKQRYTPKSVLKPDLDIFGKILEAGFCKDRYQDQLHLNGPSSSDDWFPFIDIIKKDAFIILTNANCGYIDFALNFWEHYQRLGYENIVIIAEDCVAYSHLVSVIGRYHVAPPLVRSNSRAQFFESEDFGKLVSTRPVYMHYFLNRGISVIWQDIDSVPLQDPMKFIPRGFDAVLVDDKKTDAHYSSNYLCSCFIYMNPSLQSLSTLEMWIDELKKEERKNQLAFNRAISRVRTEQKMTLAILPRSVFPNGYDFDRFENSSAWIHANYRKGALIKQDFLKQRGAWLPKEAVQIACY